MTPIPENPVASERRRADALVHLTNNRSNAFQADGYRGFTSRRNSAPSCHDRDIPPHPVHPQLHLHAALFTPNSPHPNPIHTWTLSPPVLAFACTLQHLQCLCKRAQRAAIPLRLTRTLMTQMQITELAPKLARASTTPRTRALPPLLMISLCSSFVIISASLVPG